MKRSAICGSTTAAAATPRRLTRGDEFESYPTLSRDGRQIAYVAWDDDKAGRIKLVGVGGGEGRIVTPEPGHYVEPAFSPDGSLIAYRKTQRRLPHHPAVRPRSRPLCRRRSRAARRKRVAKNGTPAACSAPPTTASSSPPTGEEDKRLLKSVAIHGDRGSQTHLISQNAADVRAVARRAVRRLDRALPGLCHAVRPFRPLGRHRARRQGAAPVAGQRRCRRLAPLVGQRPHALLEPGARPVTARISAPRAPSPAARLPAAPLLRRTRLRRRQAKPSGTHRADRRADRHHARRRSDRERHDPYRRRPHRRGRPDGLDHLPRRHPNHRRYPARRSSPG